MPKKTTLLLFFLSKSLGGDVIPFQIKLWVAFGLLYLLIELFYIGIPVVRTDSRSLAWCTVTRLPNFLRWVDYRISLAMGFCPRMVRSATCGAPLLFLVSFAGKALKLEKVAPSPSLLSMATDSRCTKLVGHKIAHLNHESFFHLNHHPLVHFPLQPKVILHFSLFQLPWFQMSIIKG